MKNSSIIFVLRLTLIDSARVGAGRPFFPLAPAATTARMHAWITGFELEADAASGAELILPADGKKAGELTSVARVPASSGERILALGYYRREAGGPGLKLRLGEQNVTVTQLPFLTH